MVQRARLDAPQIAVIGGGYAGLACAVELVRKGARVAVFERASVLGGRARLVEKDGLSVDNGQHLLLGAYSETLRLLRSVGVRPSVFHSAPLDLYYPGKFRLTAASLPAPLHLAVGLLRAQSMDWSERRACLRFIQHLKAQRFRLPVHLTVSQLLDNATQPERLRRFLWEPLCVAALNTPAAEASARVFANVLRDTLAAGASASELLIPKVDLSELFPVPAARWLGRNGGHVYVTEAITEIVPDGQRYRLEGDPVAARRFDHVVVATAPYHATDLLAPFAALAPLVESIKALPYEPILTTYLQYDDSVRLPAPMIGAEGGLAQWFFDRGQTGGPAGLIAAVISARGPHLDLPKHEVELAIHNELEALLDRRLPPADSILTITEKRATFACRPQLARPGVKTAQRGVWLAGDYVEGPYPATIEGAVRAGVQCADTLMAANRRT